MAKSFVDPSGKWGLLDTVDDVWMGTDEGPLRYNDHDLAMIAAEVFSRRMLWPITRIRAVEFTTADTKYDELTPDISADEALREMYGDEE